MGSRKTTIVVTVSSIIERDRYIKRIYTNLTKEPQTQFTIQQDQVNQIRIFHNAEKGIRVLIRTYTVIVIPVTLDLGPLYNFEGIVDYHLDETIKHLHSQISRLEALQGQRLMKGNNNGKTLGELVGQLSNSLGEY